VHIRGSTLSMSASISWSMPMPVSVSISVSVSLSVGDNTCVHTSGYALQKNCSTRMRVYVCERACEFVGVRGCACVFLSVCVFVCVSEREEGRERERCLHHERRGSDLK